jgi:hypothetical protein
MARIRATLPNSSVEASDRLPPSPTLIHDLNLRAESKERNSAICSRQGIYDIAD